MFKFLLYVLLFYIIFRYVFGSLFGNRTIHYSQHTHYHQQPPNAEEEGKITVDPRVKQKQKSGTDKLGEYVDFEEVKE
jgi:hypothetical protein